MKVFWLLLLALPAFATPVIEFRGQFIPEEEEHIRSLLSNYLRQNYSSEFLQRTTLQRIVIEPVLNSTAFGYSAKFRVGGFANGKTVHISAQWILEFIRWEKERKAKLAQYINSEVPPPDPETWLPKCDHIPHGSMTWKDCQARREKARRDFTPRTQGLDRAWIKRESEFIKSEVARGQRQFFAIFDHELFHVIDERVIFSSGKNREMKKAWAATNRPDFRYLGKPAGTFTLSKPGSERFITEDIDKKTIRPGFARPYAISDIAEDQAETFEFLMNGTPEEHQRLKEDRVLANKVALLIQFLESMCAENRCELPRRLAKFR